LKTLNDITYIYDMSRNEWRKFEGMSIVDNCEMSGGSGIENKNMFLSYFGTLTNYPDDVNGVETPIDAYIEKPTEIYYSDVLDVECDVDGTGDVKIRVDNPKFADAYIEKTFEDVENMEQHKLPYGYYGKLITVTLTNFTKIRNYILTLVNRKSRG